MLQNISFFLIVIQKMDFFYSRMQEGLKPVQVLDSLSLFFL